MILGTGNERHVTCVLPLLHTPIGHLITQTRLCIRNHSVMRVKSHHPVFPDFDHNVKDTFFIAILVLLERLMAVRKKGSWLRIFLTIHV